MPVVHRNFIFLFSLLLLTGCAGTVKNMQASSLDKTVTVKPEPGKALVVFMRPSGMGYAVQSSVFEVKGEQPVLAGIVAAKAKAGYQVEPGKHLFMAIGETAEFMDADVLADKTYYARVSPRMGMWKARFILEPLKADVLNSGEFKSDFEECIWVEKSAESERWSRENMGSVQNKRAESYPKWQSAPAEEKPALLPADGR
jgi:hypothetical protein